MGTSTMGSDLHSDKQDKLIKLQARKKELELMLASKNEELYKLCVQEVQLTGIMPPEAPLSPEVPQRERLGSVRSENRSTDGNDVHDGSDNSSRRFRPGPIHDSDQNLRKNLSHRLSTPSISGMSTKSHPRFIKRPETSCSNFFPSPPQERSHETFSMHTSHTYPALAGRHETVNENIPTDMHSGTFARHHTMTTEYMNKIYYNSNAPEAQQVSRLRETPFSSSHPDITTNYNHGNIAPQPQNGMRNTPLLYQYASHLKAQSQHLGGLSHHQQMQAPKRRPDSTRRHTLQRTQTYHLTSHSDYNQHLENMNDNYRPPLPIHQHRSQTDIQEHHLERTAPLREHNRHPMHLQLQVTTEDYGRDLRGYPDAMSPVSIKSGYSNFDSISMNKYSPLSQSDRVKEKQWYETSLDSPTKSEAPLKKSSSLKRTGSIGNSQAYEVMISTGRHSAMQSPNHILHSPQHMPHSTHQVPHGPHQVPHGPHQVPHSPHQVPHSPHQVPHNPHQVPHNPHQVPHSPHQVQSPHQVHQMPQSPLSPSGVSLDSPKNLTVIEQGKCIPYREETKPFEMSDFYKYSTKFRQPSKPGPVNPGQSIHAYNKLPMELPQYAQDHWHGHN